MLRKSLIAGALMLSTAAFADDYGRDRHNQARDVHELRQDQAARADDQQDLWRAQNLLARFDESRNRRNWRGLREMDRWVEGTLGKEIREAEVEVSKAHEEVRKDYREARADERDLRRDQYRGAGYRGGDDRRDLAHDDRQIRKDQWDARVKREHLEQKRDLFRKYRAFSGRLDPRSLDEKRSVLVALIDLESSEIWHDTMEQREDHGQLRHDGHEARQDGYRDGYRH